MFTLNRTQFIIIITKISINIYMHNLYQRVNMYAIFLIYDKKSQLFYAFKMRSFFLVLTV